MTVTEISKIKKLNLFIPCTEMCGLTRAPSSLRGQADLVLNPSIYNVNESVVESDSHRLHHLHHQCPNDCQLAPAFSESLVVRWDLDMLVVPLLRTLYFASSSNQNAKGVGSKLSGNLLLPFSLCCIFVFV